jgi:hypothetical protein
MLTRLAMERMISIVRSPLRWRDALFEVPFRLSSRTEQVCGAKDDRVMQFHHR